MAASRSSSSSMAGVGQERARAGGFLEEMGGNGGGCHRPAGPRRGVGARARPSRVRADANPAQNWAWNGSPADEKRTRVRLGWRVGPSFVYASTQTDGADEMGRSIGVALKVTCPLEFY